MRLKPMSKLIWFATLQINLNLIPWDLHASEKCGPGQSDFCVTKVWSIDQLSPPRKWQENVKSSKNWMHSTAILIAESVTSIGFQKDLLLSQKRWQEHSIPDTLLTSRSARDQKISYDVYPDVSTYLGKHMAEQFAKQSGLSKLKEGMKFSFDIKKTWKNTEKSLKNEDTKSAKAETQKAKSRQVRYGLILEDIKPNKNGPNLAAIKPSDYDLLPYAPPATPVWRIGALPMDHGHIISYRRSHLPKPAFSANNIWEAIRYPAANFTFLDPKFTGSIKSNGSINLEGHTQTQIFTLDHQGQLYSAEIHGDLLNQKVLDTVHRFQAPLYHHWFLVQEFNSDLNSRRSGIMKLSKNQNPYKAGIYANYLDESWEVDFSQSLSKAMIEFKLVKDFSDDYATPGKGTLINRFELSINKNL